MTTEPKAATVEEIPGLCGVRMAARTQGVEVRVARLKGRGRRPDTAHVQFRKGPFVVATWWPGSGRLRIGPRLLLAQSVLAAWQEVAAISYQLAGANRPAST